MPVLTEAQALARLNETWFRDLILTEVIPDKNSYSLNAQSLGFGFSMEYGVTPRVGDAVRLYEHRGSMIRGMDLNGSPIFFKTDEDLDKEHKKFIRETNAKRRAQFKEQKEKLDEQFNSLPEVFKRRIRWFRKHNKNFRWEHEAYELLVCVDALKIAEKCATPEAVKTFMDSSYDFQKSFVPDLSDGHSGNSFGMSCRLAYNYLEDEEMVFYEHGALVPLVGCDSYGCAHPRPGIEEFAEKKGWNDDA